VKKDKPAFDVSNCAGKCLRRELSSPDKTIPAYTVSNIAGVDCRRKVQSHLSASPAPKGGDCKEENAFFSQLGVDSFAARNLVTAGHKWSQMVAQLNSLLMNFTLIGKKFTK